jgi:hypothetical protein
MAGAAGAVWGLGGVLLLLGSAIYRLTPLAIEGFSHHFFVVPLDDAGIRCPQRSRIYLKGVSLFSGSSRIKWIANENAPCQTYDDPDDVRLSLTHRFLNGLPDASLNDI